MEILKGFAWAIVIASVVLIIIRYFIAKQFYFSACEKGYTQRHYFWLPFICGLIGYLLVISLPCRSRTEGGAGAESAKISEIETRNEFGSPSSSAVGAYGYREDEIPDL